MKFSCTFTDNTREVICHILSASSKLNEIAVCALVLSDEDGFEIRAVTESASAFGKIEIAQFSDFHVVSKANNRIAIEVQILSLLSAFKIPADTCDFLTFKLTKNKQNMVCFTLSTKSRLTDISLTQDVPVVRLLQPSELSMYREPLLGDAQITIAFPEAKLAKTVLDRMKNLGKYIQIRADQNSGKLSFRMDTDIVSTRTVFDGLDMLNHHQQQEGEEEHAPRACTAVLNCKEFYAITSAVVAFQRRTNNTVLAMVKHMAVCVHVSFDDESHLTFYLATVPTPIGTGEEEQAES